jgi:hypothetical protein
MTITLYGIPNCDTVKRARAWLAAQGIEHAFHDFKKAGVPKPASTPGWPRPAGRRCSTAGHRLASAARRPEGRRARCRQRPRGDAGAGQHHQAPGGRLG